MMNRFAATLAATQQADQAVRVVAEQAVSAVLSDADSSSILLVAFASDDSQEIPLRQLSLILLGQQVKLSWINLSVSNRLQVLTFAFKCAEVFSPVQFHPLRRAVTVLIAKIFEQSEMTETGQISSVLATLLKTIDRDAITFSLLTLCEVADECTDFGRLADLIQNVYPSLEELFKSADRSQIEVLLQIAKIMRTVSESINIAIERGEFDYENNDMIMNGFVPCWSKVAIEFVLPALQSVEGVSATAPVLVELFKTLLIIIDNFSIECRVDLTMLNQMCWSLLNTVRAEFYRQSASREDFGLGDYSMKAVVSSVFPIISHSLNTSADLAAQEQMLGVIFDYMSLTALLS